MYLKKLEIYGFKSFAEKVSLEFSPRISAIIGPNGCGKSNIIDAVRWVLGEQNARVLRGSRMEEIIFSGSENRKPLNFAEVSLLFDHADSFLNVEHTQVEITRRLYRSGESEYFINKTPCRLKDINDLFTDTGVGREVYSIVGQNRVEEIINARPEERRELFEEASGVLKYKQRKKDAQRRLDEMKQNLQRVSDLTGELENQVAPLEEQARVARRYRELSSRYREQEKKLLGCQLYRTRNRLDNSNQKLENIQNEMASLMNRQARLDLKLEEQKRLESETAREKSYYEQEINTYHREKEKIENNQRLLEEKEKNLVQKIADNCSRHEQLMQRKDKIVEKQGQWCRESENNRERLQQLEKEMEQHQKELEEYEYDDILRSMEDLQQELVTATSRKEGIDSQVSELNKQQTSLEHKKEELVRQLKEDEDSLEDMEIRREELQERRQELKNHLEETGKAVQEAERGMAGLRKKREAVQEKLASLREQKSRQENRLWMLEKWKNESYRAGDGIRELWEAAGQQEENIEGIEETFFSVVSVPAEYRRAIEAALEEKAYTVLTSDRQSAFKALSFLKKKQKGRASFLPLDILSSPGNKDTGKEKMRYYEHDKVLASAEEVIQVVDSRYAPAVSRLMREVLLVDSLEEAMQVAAELDFTCTVVSLQGEAVLPGGIIRGGDAPSEEKTAIWGGEEDLAELRENIEKLNREIEKKREEIKALESEEKEKRRRLNENKEEKNRLQREASKVEQEEETLAVEMDNCRKNMEQKERQMNSLQEEAEQLSSRKKELQKQYSGLEEREKDAGQKLEKMKSDYQQVLNQKEELKEKLTELQIGYNKLNEQQRYLEEKITGSHRELEDLEEEMQQKREENRQFHRELKELGSNRQEEEEKLSGLAENSIESSRKYEEVLSRYNSLQARVKEIEKESEDLREQVKKLERKERQKELEKTRLQTEVDHLVESYREKFGPPEEDPAYQEGEHSRVNEEEVQGNMERLKEEIEALGAVNSGSIDELARLNERLEFLKSQKEDLENGEKSLHQVLSRIDEEIKQSFQEGLNYVNQYFQEAFKELFGGGHALLKLTDPEDLLESGVEIVARPPGKNLQNISLLSSGEKALTVIALIFSILTYKPAPFYFLDEIESALDDYNLNKFTEYLQKISREAQFILVTHRKTTTEIADLIYGITMQEYGVTRVLSIKTDQKVS